MYLERNGDRIKSNPNFFGWKIVKGQHNLVEMEYFVTNSLFSFLSKALKRQKTAFLGEYVAIFMSTGYSSKNSWK
jgi:hypothetical protein